MSWRYAFTRNWAELEPSARDPALRPIVMACPPAEALRQATDLIAALPRWTVVATDPAARTLHANRTTRLWRFVDDIHLRFDPDSQGTRITGRSQARIGSADLGQNARNLRELRKVLSAQC